MAHFWDPLFRVLKKLCSRFLKNSIFKCRHNEVLKGQNLFVTIFQTKIEKATEASYRGSYCSASGEETQQLKGWKSSVQLTFLDACCMKTQCYFLMVYSNSSNQRFSCQREAWVNTSLAVLTWGNQSRNRFFRQFSRDGKLLQETWNDHELRTYPHKPARLTHQALGEDAAGTI